MSIKKTEFTSSTSSRLVWLVAVVFVLQIAVWTAWITFASKHYVAEVPLANTR
jgi:hypothetical protein